MIWCCSIWHPFLVNLRFLKGKYQFWFEHRDWAIYRECVDFIRFSFSPIRGILFPLPRETPRVYYEYTGVTGGENHEEPWGQMDVPGHPVKFSKGLSGWTSKILAFYALKGICVFFVNDVMFWGCKTTAWAGRKRLIRVCFSWSFSSYTSSILLDQCPEYPPVYASCFLCTCSCNLLAKRILLRRCCGQN